MVSGRQALQPATRVAVVAACRTSRPRSCPGTAVPGPEVPVGTANLLTSTRGVSARGDTTSVLVGRQGYASGSHDRMVPANLAGLTATLRTASARTYVTWPRKEGGRGPAEVEGGALHAEEVSLSPAAALALALGVTAGPAIATYQQDSNTGASGAAIALEECVVESSKDISYLAFIECGTS